jgi:alpha-L-arabinofuranosidase
VALVVDEWGAWHAAEPGTNPRFLYQQNTLRDALVAALTLNIFHQHCDRVRMTNIAQMVNVLQAMILTQREKMILTPTYHVFDLYKVHQDARLLPVELQSADYQLGGEKIPGLQASASRDKEGKIHLSICNLNPNTAVQLDCALQGVKASTVTGRVLTAEKITSHNTFENPRAVEPTEFSGTKLTADGVTLSMPAKSVVVLEIK